MSSEPELAVQEGGDEVKNAGGGGSREGNPGAGLAPGTRWDFILYQRESSLAVAIAKYMTVRATP
jgi:hypothetical protein